MPSLSLSQLFSPLKTLIILFILLIFSVNFAIQSLIAIVTGSDQRLLTAAQFLSYLEEKIPAIRYPNSESLECCSVCLSEFVENESVRNLKCNHLFHKDCLDKWFQKCRSTCPLCRTIVLPDEVVASYRRPKDEDQLEFDRRDAEIVFLLSPLHGNGIFSSIW